MGAPRRIDLYREDGPLTVAGGAVDVVVLSFRLPVDAMDANAVAYGWEVDPAAGADFVRFTVREEHSADVPFQRRARTQQGTVPIPYTCRIVLQAGKLYRVLVTNEDPVNSYRVAARLELEL